MSFHNVRFPSCLEGFLNSQTSFITSKITLSSGREVRSLDSEYSKKKFLLKNCFLSESEFAIFNNFFKARRGSRYAFLVQDFADYIVDKQSIGLGDGEKREFLLYKTYHDDQYPYVRRNFIINEDSLKIFLAGNQINNWQFIKNKKTIILENPPEKEMLISVSFEFYVMSRFVEDSFDYKLRNDGTIEIMNVSLIEVIE